MFVSLLVPSNPGRLGMPIYIVTMEISQHSQQGTLIYIITVETWGGGYYTFVVVPVVSVEAQIMCVYYEL